MTLCFADTGVGCSVLYKKECRGCKFMKTREKFEHDSQVSAAALKAEGTWENYQKIYKALATKEPKKRGKNIRH